MPVVKFKPAKITLAREKFTLTVDESKTQIPVGEIVDAASVQKLVGKTGVEVALSGKAVVAIGRRRAGPSLCYWIICYIPAPDHIRRINPELRQELINQYEVQKIIDQKFADELRAGSR
jgi:hypothetical protein